MQGLTRFHQMIWPMFWVASLALLASACDEDPTNSGLPQGSGACASTQAQLAIYDSFTQILCGCNEPAQEVPAGTPLTCTVKAGTTVYFWYPADKVTHQIVASGLPSFAPSPISDPNADNVIRTHVVNFSDAGTYSFEDAYNTSLYGSIVVQ